MVVGEAGDRLTVAGVVSGCGSWGIDCAGSNGRPVKTKGGYVLTHIETGYCVGSSDDPEVLMGLADRLQGSRFSSSDKSQNVLTFQRLLPGVLVNDDGIEVAQAAVDGLGYWTEI